MTFKLSLATATALGLLMGGAMAGDNNKAASEQDGNENALVVKQDGDSNTAGNSLSTARRLYQFGDYNSITVNQTGNSNHVGNDSDASYMGLHQTGGRLDQWSPLRRGDGNVIVIDQTSGAVTGAANGNKVSSIRQISGAGGSGTTNSASITQSLEGAGDRAAHYVGRVRQEHTGGAANTLVIEQTGSHTRTSGPGAQSNRIGGYNDSGYQDWHGGITQKGAGNALTVTQQDLDGRRTGDRGPGNVVYSLDQDGTILAATVLQNGFHNYVREIYQRGSNNTATISLTGTGNGAILPSGTWAGDNLPKTGVLDGAAGAAGAAASSVVQITGTGNQVHYTVSNGDGNQFGFRQDGTDNLATGITIDGGNYNHLGVNQKGMGNQLVLSTITGSENIIGLKQDGTSNLATVVVTGDRNVGYNDFSPLKVASGLGLTAGLLDQIGTGNSVSLTVDGNGNVFASKQGASLASSSNTITASQNGANHEAAVMQAGSSNVAALSQGGSGNSASISQ